MRPAGPLDFLTVEGALARFRLSLSGAGQALASEAGADFDSWEAAFWSRFGQDPPAAFVDGERVVLVDGPAGHRIVAYADAGVLPGALAALRSDPRVRAISAPPGLDLPPGPGFRPVERWEHRFDLACGPADAGAPPGGYAVEGWDPARVSEAADLLAATNGATLDGLFLAWPELPTPDACRRLLDGLAAPTRGPLAPDVSFMASREGRLVGLTLVTLPSDHEALLFEIAVRFRHRGTGLAPYLLDRIKACLRPRGYRTVRFLACGRNAAVLALFRPEEVRSSRLDGGWVWLRDIATESGLAKDS